MRRGDCCTLLRSAVDLEGGFITVKTSKTNETVQSPIFPLLRGVLEKALAKPAPRPPFFVFPELEAYYRLNPDHLTDRVRRVMKAAGFFNPKDNEDKRPSRGAMQQKRKHRMRTASRRDFHSLRVTWVTVALTVGVPLEIVQKVTGHRTTEIVLKHYFQPGREEFRRTLAGKLPALLGGRSKPMAEPSTSLICWRNSPRWSPPHGDLFATSCSHESPRRSTSPRHNLFSSNALSRRECRRGSRSTLGN